MNDTPADRPMQAKAPEVHRTLSMRSTTHGHFRDNARFAIALRAAMRNMTPHWTDMPAEQQLALDEIALKMARILSGGFRTAEHWHDIQGYAQLGERVCSKGS